MSSGARSRAHPRPPSPIRSCGGGSPPRNISCLIILALALIATAPLRSAEKLTDYANPFLGTTAPTGIEDVGFTPPWKVWGGLTFPGASLPNAMVQLSPVTQFKSGAGYEYEHDTILGFAHTNKGHWNYCNIPILPVTGKITPDDYASPFSHKNETASPGYYQVYLERYKINAELTTTLRCGYHKYTFKNPNAAPRLVVNLADANDKVKDWKIAQAGDNAIMGYQNAREKVYFYATTSRPIKTLDYLKARDGTRVPVLTFADALAAGSEGQRPGLIIAQPAGLGNGDGKPMRAEGPRHGTATASATENVLELKIALSFVSIENAKQNLEAELANKTFDQTRAEATATWEALLSKIQVTGGTEKQKRMFYSCLYRAFLWPALRSDANGDYTDERGNIARKPQNHAYYTIPSLWDDYRNKLVLLTMLAPKVTADVIQSMIDRGQSTGFMPTFFHGDHAAPFIAGAYLRGLRGFDVKSAYALLLRNATDPSPRNRARPYLADYIKLGYVPTPADPHPHTETKSTAGVTKTLEYAYDDYALALLARKLNDPKTHDLMMQRSRDYANVFDPSTGLMRGRQANGDWVTPFDPQQPYYEYMYREANAWQSSFFAPHDTEGLIKLYPTPAAFERQLDKLFLTPWNPRHMARNVNSFIGQYCHGNQPDHGFPYLYYWVGRQEKSQAILNLIMSRFYGMRDGITLCGMDDAGEMTSWYVFNALGLYPYSPADDTYIVTVPIFDEIKIDLSDHELTITRPTPGLKIESITTDGQKLPGYFITHRQLLKTRQLLIKAAPATTN